MIKITIQGESMSDIAKQAIALAKQFQTTPAAGGDANPAPKDKTAAPKAEGKAPPAETPKPADTKEISYAQDVAPRVLKLAEKKGRPAAVAVLQQFGVEKAPQLTADQYPGVIAALDAAIAA